MNKKNSSYFTELSNNQIALNDIDVLKVADGPIKGGAKEFFIRLGLGTLEGTFLSYIMITKC